MPGSPLDTMILRTVKCTRCGAAYGECNCWAKITLRCPKCKRTMQVTKEDTDPSGTAVVETTCDRCDDGGSFPETHYFDAGGRWFDGEGFRVRTALKAGDRT